MVSCTIRVTDKYLNGSNVSIQQTHLELYLADKLSSIVLRDERQGFIREYAGPELARLLGSAISNGRREAPNGDFYYLANR